jgi:hypothetical protein
MTGLSVGRVLSRSFSVLGDNFLPFVLLTALVDLPLLAIAGWVLFLSSAGLDAESTELRIAGLLTVAAYAVLRPLSTATVTYGVLQQLRGRHASVADCLRIGMGRTLAVLGVALATGLLIGLGAMLFCIPGIILLCGWYVATPAAVVERLGVGQSMQRSWDLTRGSKWPVLGVIVILAILSWIGEAAIELPFSTIEGAGLLTPVGVVGGILGWLTGVLVQSLGAVTGAVTYHDLRLEKEGAQSEDLARVFD